VVQFRCERPERVWLLLLPLVALLASCDDSDTRTSGPLDFSGGGSDYCIPAAPGSAATFGNIYLDNEDPLTLTALSFAEMQGLTLLGAVVAPEDVPGVAGWSGFPPEGAPDITEESWLRTHRPLEGAVIGEETEVISIGLRLDTAAGLARSALLDYEIDGARYQTEIPNTYEMRKDCSEPTDTLSSATSAPRR
jgi:hypothetical protein